jgi:hypothetical protein
MVSGQPHAPDAFAPFPLHDTYLLHVRLGNPSASMDALKKRKICLKRNADVTANSNTVQIQYLILHNTSSQIIQ